MRMVVFVALLAALATLVPPQSRAVPKTEGMNQYSIADPASKPVVASLKLSPARSTIGLPQFGKQASRDLVAEQVLYRFRGLPARDGSQPTRTLVADGGGALYGSTAFGGAQSFPGDGTVFKLSPTSAGNPERTLYRFQGIANGDGEQVEANLIVDAAGTIYGTTVYGGSSSAGGNGGGIVFSLIPRLGGGYAESVLYRFLGFASGDGAQPYAGVIEDSSGALYGTTAFGGVANNGTVFKLTPTSHCFQENVIYSFRGLQAGDGSQPYSGLTMDDAGALYGMTASGGSTVTGFSNGGGTVYKLTPDGSVYDETVIHRFLGGGGGDGADPVASLIVDNVGALYGTASLGGSLAAGDRGLGGGIAFALFPSNTGYTEKVLYTFQGPNNDDGYFPQCALLRAKDGYLFGTSSFGGLGGGGIVFALTPKNGRYAERVLYRFKKTGGDGSNPYSSLVFGIDGALYGTTIGGGNGDGSIFRIAPVPGAEKASDFHVKAASQGVAARLVSGYTFKSILSPRQGHNRRHSRRL